MSTAGKPSAPNLRPAERFSREILAAVAGGASPDELTLRLTLMDASKIKRDPQIALSDVSFGNGGMRYLGVRVLEGGVRASELVEGAPPEPVIEEPVAKAKAKPKPRAKKAAAPKVAAAEATETADTPETAPAA